MDNFLKIWAVRDNNIVEKVHLYIDNPFNSVHVPSSTETLQFVVRGSYFKNSPLKDKSGSELPIVPIMDKVCRKFDYLDEANAYIKLTFQEFFDKYNNYLGRAIIDDLVIVDGKPEGFKYGE